MRPAAGYNNVVSSYKPQKFGTCNDTFNFKNICVVAYYGPTSDRPSMPAYLITKKMRYYLPSLASRLCSITNKLYTHTCIALHAHCILLVATGLGGGN